MTGVDRQNEIRERLLGLRGTVPATRENRTVKVGDRVLIRGRVLRVHKESGFVLVEVEGDSEQAAILIHGTKAEVSE